MLTDALLGLNFFWQIMGTWKAFYITLDGRFLLCRAETQHGHLMEGKGEAGRGQQRKR